MEFDNEEMNFDEMNDDLQSCCDLDEFEKKFKN
jgi:hypothetical protein